MIVWSSFILDEMGGLRSDALPTCPECEDNPSFLVENSGSSRLFPARMVSPLSLEKSSRSQWSKAAT